MGIHIGKKKRRHRRQSRSLLNKAQLKRTKQTPNILCKSTNYKERVGPEDKVGPENKVGPKNKDGPRNKVGRKIIIVIMIMIYIHIHTHIYIYIYVCVRYG